MTLLSEPEESKYPSVTMAQFLMETPPGEQVVVTDFDRYRRDANSRVVTQPVLTLHCEVCDGPRTFTSPESVITAGSRERDHVFFLYYYCRNCHSTRKHFAVIAPGGMTRTEGVVVMKIGELPAFGPPIPTRVFKLVADDQDSLLKGYQCERQSLGVGAFSYYRQVVERQWKRILQEIIRVAERTNAPAEVVEPLKAALNETQFGAAVAAARGALPPALLINKENPLTLLHTALSDGLHARGDTECLEIAGDVREVLFELADRITAALKDEKKLRESVGRLATRRTEARTKSGKDNQAGQQAGE